MRLSTSTNIFFNRPDQSKASVEESMRLCAEAGYRVMDMNFHDCTTFCLPFVGKDYLNWIQGVHAVADKLNITFSQAHAPFYNFCDRNATNKEEIDILVYRAIDCSEILGVKWLVIHAGTDFHAINTVSSSREKNLRYFAPILEYAEKKGVGIAFENLWERNISPFRRYTAGIEELLELVDAMHSPNAGICWDTDHAALMKQDQEKAIELIGSRLKATHISDCIDENSDHLLPFMGNIEWKPIMRALRINGYSGDLTYEIHRYTSKMPLKLVPAALRFGYETGTYLLSLGRGNDEV